MSHHPAMDLDEELFSFVFHHIFFPKKLPQEAEEHLAQLEYRMVAVIQAVLQEFIRNLTPESQPQWEFAYNLVDSWLQMHMDQGISQQSLEIELSKLKSAGALACHIRAQNCGLVASYDREKDVLLIDAFEVSCQDAPVLSSPGALIRHFPGVSVTLSGNKLNDTLFCSYLASSISQLASEEVSEMLPKTTKANTKVDEHRQTTHPGLITEGLMTELLALGEHNEHPDKILKCVRDEVNWCSALLPWRRSPAWLVLRVALQVVLRRCFSENEDQVQYKNFMLFLMARLSAGANRYGDPTNAVDCWAIIRQRLGRRIFKLGHDVFPFVVEEVISTSNHLLDKLKCIQTQIGASDGADIPFVPPSASPEDLHMSLVNSRPYLQAKMRLSPEKARRTQFDPTDTINLSWSDGFPVLKHGSVAALGEFEGWVEEHLQSWFEAQPTSKYEQACLKIEDAIEQYFTLAQLKYQADPRATSLMVLVLVELWAVLDKIAVQICPLLKAFSPEVPRRFLEPLLLSKMSEMRRARDIEHHLSTRHEGKVENYPSIFSDPEPNCFGAQYFDRSDYHQKLEVRIEKHATQLRERKRLEWKDLHAKYKELQDQTAQLEHRNHHGYIRRRRYVSLTAGCEKCSIIGKANQLSIEVYEWPLPPEDIARKCAVFELDIPIWFASWRNVTWTLVDHLPQRPRSSTGGAIYKWLDYSGVNEFKVRRHSKLELASYTKPWGTSHYRKHRSVDVTFEVVSPENALRLRLLDSSQSAWVSNQTQESTVKTMCTIQLPSGPCSKLQYTVDSTSHHQNEVLARQADCDRMLDLDEFIAYGCLRSGENVQWHNILRELASSALSLNEQSVVSLVQQTAWELGTPSSDPYSIRRVTHRAFEDIGFGDRLLQTLQDILEAIERNWNQYWTLELVVTLAVRILALSNESPSPERVINFLRQCRQVAMEWCDSLSKALSTDQGEDVGRKQQLILRVASICQTTYDVERTNISQVMSSSQDLFCFVRSSLLLFENAASESCELPASVKTMVENSQKIAFLIRESVKNLIMAHPSGLNEAIHRGISCLEISEPWSICEGSNAWVATRTGSTFKGFSQHVHFNYITGEILVDGTPPGKLPRSYLSDPLYQGLFGQRSLPVIPSNLPGASFVSSQNIEGFEVHFGMAAGEFFIKTRKGSQILQLIPHAVFKEDFPRPFVTEYYHWLNLQTGAVVFRPLNQPWKSCESNWHLSFDPQMPDQMLMQAGSKTLVDIRSRPFALLDCILNVLDETEEIILVQTSTGTLEAELSRLRLKFFVNSDGRVVSKEFGAFVDSTQRIGCLYGLVDKLVLIDSSNARCVIIPYGEPVVTRKGYHVSLKVKRPEGDRVKYMVYSMDTHLQILRCSDSLAALYQAYLHALTSFPVPDHFTHRSGTAEAIRILRQGCLRSSFPPNSDCIKNLKRIAALTPVRVFYPPKPRVMQTVAWSGNLGQLAQDDDFQPLSLEILEFADQFSSFHVTEPRARQVSYAGSMNLLERARCRNEQLRCAEVGGPPSLCTKKTYPSRDQDIRSPRSNSVYELTALVRDWPSAVNHSSNVVETMRKFTNVSTHSPNLSHSSCSQLMGLSTESDWVALYNFCRSKSRSRDTYSLISVFAKVGFGGIIDQSVLLQLLSIAFSASCREIPWPCSQVTSFDLTMGEDFDIRKIEDAIWECYTPFTPSTDHTRPNQFQADTDARKEWADRRRQVVGYCGRHIQDQWPTRTPGLPSQSSVSLVRREAAQQKCQSLCSTWVQNGEFLGFLRQVQDKAPPSGNGKAKAQAISNPPTCCNDVEHSLFKPPGIIELIQESPLMGHEAECVSFTYRGASLIPRPTPELRALAEYFKTNSDICKQGYGNELARSIQALEALSNSAAEAEDPEGCVSFNWQEARSEIVSHQQGLKTQRDTLWGVIIAALRDGYSIVGFDTVCPSITVWSVLAVLGSDQWTMIPDQWRLLLVAFGKSISTLRRCERLISCIDMRDLDGFFKEAENPGYEGWEPSAHPTWLLLELEQNITIRKRQVEVAGQIIQPDCDGNALLQLNMGEGKTTVITGMTVVHLADGRILVRLIVLKPLLRQSVNDLSQRLGGLINRRIYHIPVSRNTELDDSTIRKLQSIYGKCLRDRGILIALPEHILSFRLLGLDAAESSPNIYPSLIKFEHWLQLHCRDIIDESDEVLDTKFQLVYTMGTQKSMDGLSSRWETTQDLLRLVSTQAKRLHQDDPNCIEVDQTGYRYPLLRFLEDDAIGRLLRYILQEISENGIPGLPFNQWTTKVKSSALKFIKDLELSKEDEATVRGEFKDGVFITKLLVLRGHFAYGLLRFSLANKRWLVEYGLHPLRCFMAVPYRAKGVPSDNAEFGHPDVAVTLTCLSYYYEGLQEKQLRTCFLLLAKENDPSTVYHNWVAQCVHDLPFSLRTYSGVNLEDGMAFKKVLFPILRYQKEILDFYLSRVVFSREAKEFPRKLSSSAWDIPAQRGLQLTTGFSGTNDNRSLLPLSICQRDLPDLLHTNAMVLGYLLRDCNRQCVMAQDEKGHQLGVDQLLKLVLSCGERSSTAQPVRVLIDVGAQILEAGNQSVAEKWLSITTVDEVQAAIFFNENDELMVIDRDGLIETLLSSPFRQRLGACLVFLDQHHSRGVDLKLPPTTRAAVTLGPRLTKDKLVQACNRLRGLAKRQSLLFLVPPEVSHNMRSQLGISSDRDFTSADVLRWSMLQTCDALDNLRPLWANQGLQYYRKIALWDLLVKESNASTQVAVSMQEPEAKTLLQHYLPSDADRLSVLDDTAPNDSNIEDVRVLLNALRSTTGQSVSSAYLHEEQEREIACEVERERQVARPPNYIPHQHRLHEDIEYFAKFGKFPGDHPSRSALTLAFEGLANTSVGDTQYPNGLGPGLYSSWDFIQTVQVREHDMEDEFSKPPHWVLSSVHNNDLVIVSQYEANAVLPIVRQSKHTRLNIYTARFTKPMRSFGNLDFFGIGSGCPMPTQRMRCCLELFAGSLYFDNFEEYKYFRYFLGLLTENYENIPQEGITSEGFVEFFTRFRLRWPLDSPFMVNPLPFLAALVDIRTRGGGYQQSHVGSVIRAIQLTPETF